MSESYYFERYKEIQVPSQAEIQSYTSKLFQCLPRLLPQDFSKECPDKHLHIYLLGLEKKLNECQISNFMRSRYIDRESLGVVEVPQKTISQLEEAIKKRLDSQHQQKVKLISQNACLRQSLEALEQEARDIMNEYLRRINQALGSLHISRLEAELKEPYKATVSQLQAKMDLQISELLHEVATQGADKDKLASELTSLARQLARRESQVSELAKKCAQLQQENQRQVLIAQHNNSRVLLDFWNKKVVPTYSNYSKITSEQEILTQLQHNQEVKRQQKSSAFQISQILQDNRPVKDFIIAQIKAHTKLNISSTRLLYRYDNHHKDFGEYLKELSTPFTMVLRLENGRICGGFCPGLNSAEQSSFLFTYSSEGTIIRMAAKQQVGSGCSFTSNQLIFGFNELIIANNQRGKEIKINSSSFGAKYFEKLSRFAQINQNNICRFQELEFHEVSLDG